MTKYQEYKAKAKKLDDLLDVLRSTHIQVDTIYLQNTPQFERIRLQREEETGSTFRVYLDNE